MTSIRENKTAWELATQLGHFANQLDAWADECRSCGHSPRHVQPVRNLAREIRSELHGLTPSKEVLQEILAIRQHSIAELKRIIARYESELQSH
jgi:hypothetical protein